MPQMKGRLRMDWWAIRIYPGKIGEIKSDCTKWIMNSLSEGKSEVNDRDKPICKRYRQTGIIACSWKQRWMLGLGRDISSSKGDQCLTQFVLQI